VRHAAAYVSFCLACLLSGWPLVSLRAVEWELGPTGSKASFRSIAAPSSQVIWIGGSQGTILKSTDGGNSWANCSPLGFAALEFRGLHAWDAQRACAASAGSPAVILLTEDGGQSWSTRYQHDSPQAFFDGLRFWDANHGIALSDPVDGRWLMVETGDAGVSWQALSDAPLASVDEAAFAASNSALIVQGAGAAWFGTGGAPAEASRIFWRAAGDEPWQAAVCPLPSQQSSGVFSLAYQADIMVAVGGDYRPEAQSTLTAAWSEDRGRTWQAASVPPPAYRSAVVALPSEASLYLDQTSVAARFLATGPTGSDYSVDGRRWVNFTSTGFHALAATEQGLFAVGSEGRFARLPLRLGDLHTKLPPEDK
jgi:photosystem II stability/assembly factor-like uncharacterized protein